MNINMLQNQYLAKIYVLIHAILASFLLNAQEPLYVNFQLEDGLPSNELYQVVQDNRGYLWIGTDRGLVKYNGYEFIDDFGPHEISNLPVFGFHQDHSDRLWFYTRSGGIAQINGDSIVIPDFNDSLVLVLENKVVYRMYVDLNDTIWLGIKGKYEHVKITPNGRIILEQEDKVPFVGHLSVVDKGGFLLGTPKINDDSRNNLNQFLFTSDSTSKLVQLPGEIFGTGTGNSVLRMKEQLFFAQHDGIIAFTEDSVISSSQLPANSTLSLCQDKEGNVWVGLYHAGALCYPKGNLSVKPKCFLQGYSVSSILQDREGGMWFTTLDNGLFYAQRRDLLSEKIVYQDRSTAVSSLAIADSLIWIGTKQGQLFSKPLIQPLETKLELDGLGVVFFLRQTGNKLVVGVSRKSELLFKTKRNLWLLPTNAIGLNNAVDSVWVLMGAGMSGPRPIPMIEVEYRFPVKHHVSSIAEWQNHIYVGGDRGLSAVGGVNKDSLVPYALPESCWVTCMGGGDKFLFLGTKKFGLIILGGESPWIIGTQEHLPTGFIETLEVENDSVVWVGSKKGLTKLELNHAQRKAVVTNVSRTNGLPSNDISDLLFHNNVLYVASSYGVTQFPANLSFHNPVAPPVYLQNVEVNGEDVEWVDDQVFDPDAIAFDFSYLGLSYGVDNPNPYRYRLIGLDQSWSMSSSRQVRYMLSPGSYTFEVEASNESGVWSASPARYQFTILAPIWQRAWFVVLLILGIVSVSILIVYVWIKRLRARSALEIGMARSQNQTLNAQLKPHFIFNALNSIHWYIRQNDKEKSSLYIQLFARLIRQVLNNSGDPLITLDQELAMLENYLKIEQLRFKERMEYCLEVDPNLDTEALFIPTQLIQPYVENAIWHGLMPNDGNGKIWLKVNQEGENIICTIEDDGVGRSANLDKGQRIKEHKSSGMRMNQQRLDLLKAIYNKTVTVDIIDLVSDIEEPTGTRVVLTIPIF